MKTSKRAANKQIKVLRSELNALRMAWEKRGVADGEFARSREIQRQITDLEISADLAKRPVIDSLYR